MEFRFKGVKVKLPEGVETSKFDANRVIASAPEDVVRLFNEYGIDLREECPGVFLKGFTLNEKELAEVSSNLKVYQEKGLIDIIKANTKNLQVRVFKSSFIKRLLGLITEGKPYLNQDNSFADFLLNNKVNEFNELDNNINTRTNTEVEMNTFENKSADKLVEMNTEEKQVYNEIVEKLNYLVLANPLDTTLSDVVNNAINRVQDAILRDEYRFLNLQEMVSSVMFDELKLSDYDETRIKDLVLGAFPDEERKMR